MYADRLGCVPEVATILALLHKKVLIGATGLLLDRPDWPDEWRFEASLRHRALRSACEDDAEFVLQLAAAWDLIGRRRAAVELSRAGSSGPGSGGSAMTCSGRRRIPDARS